RQTETNKRKREDDDDDFQNEQQIEELLYGLITSIDESGKRQKTKF
ncbi:unnamed protein product, partial [Rotaria magnacalcarata]